MWNYLYEIIGEESEYCGEMFFVQCDTLEEAKEILLIYFTDEKLRYIGPFNDEEAEAMGYDTY